LSAYLGGPCLRAAQSFLPAESSPEFSVEKKILKVSPSQGFKNSLVPFQTGAGKFWPAMCYRAVPSAKTFGPLVLVAASCGSYGSKTSCRRPCSANPLVWGGAARRVMPQRRKRKTVDRQRRSLSPLTVCDEDRRRGRFMPSGPDDGQVPNYRSACASSWTPLSGVKFFFGPFLANLSRAEPAITVRQTASLIGSLQCDPSRRLLLAAVALLALVSSLLITSPGRAREMSGAASSA
jgi:hypothetical protein